MEHKGTLVVGGAVLAGVGITYLGWRLQLRELSEAIERGDDQAKIDTLTGELLDLGELGRRVAGLSAVLLILLLMMFATGVDGSVAPEPFKFGFHPS